MADPVVQLTNGVPTSGTGAITTLGLTLVDGANLTMGATTDAAVVAGATGSVSAKLRAISRDILSNIVLAAGSAVIGSVTQSGAWVLSAGSAVIGSVTQSGAWVLSAGSAVIGKVGINDGTSGLTLMTASSGAPATTVVAVPVTIRDMLAPGSALSTASAPVVIASDQVAVPVKPAAAATGGATNQHFFSVTGTPTATQIKASAGTLYGVQAVNTGAAPVYLKLYNVASGSVTVGTTVPLMTISVPTVATTGSGIVIPFPVGVAFGTAMSWALTNVAADNDATAVAVGVTLNIQFA